MKYDKIYLDMDGVIADFDGYFEYLYGISPKDFNNEYGDTEFWEKVYETPKFFRDMPAMKLHPIIKLCKKYTNNLVILSAPSRTNRALCMIQKREWLDIHNLASMPAIFENDKHKYAKPGRLLIDDTPSKCEKFKNAGGEAFLYKDFDGLFLFFEGKQNG